MPIRDGKPETWRVKGLTDAEDGSNSFPGAMSILQNLIPDPRTTSVFVPRPAAVELEDFSTLVSGGQVSAGYIRGDIFYGLIGSGMNVGYDQPFAFNLETNQLIPVTGITAANVPITQPTAGDWAPPTMDSLSHYIIVTHPGFTGANGYIGWFDITNPLKPVWNSGTTGINALAGVPVACFEFGGRMYYAVNNATEASDQQLPLQRTNASQVLIYGDNTAVTALAGLPLYNQLGGIIQALLVFKGSVITYQLTGDYSGSPSGWAINTLNVATGTNAPRTLCTTRDGLAFVASDGLRIIQFTGNVTDPIGNNGQGITLPFINAVFPSRMCAAFNQSVLRITVQDGSSSVQRFQEYWYDFNLKIWTGPHTFPVALILPWRNTFVAASPIIQGV